MKKICCLLLLFTMLFLQANQIIKIQAGKTDYEFTPRKTGTYWIISHTRSRIPVGQQHFAKLRIADGPFLTRRLLPYNAVDTKAHLERVQLQAGKRYILHFEFDHKTTDVTQLQIILTKPYRVLKEARDYRPELIPPKGHPRLFVNPQYLMQLKKNLSAGDNLPVWNQVKKTAFTPFQFNPESGSEISYDKNLLEAVRAKAFYHLVTGDQKIGRESADLILAYAQNATLGNGQDICRKVGEIIYSASLVYDWCYALLSNQEKAILRQRMLFYAAELETSWPPFRQYASAGHGNEAQFNKDLLCMALAVYDEDPLPYQYVAYQIFEIWLPLKKITYKSGRHSQGSSYGQYRAQFDFLAALQLWRVFGVKVLPEEAGTFHHYWHYMRLPDGCFLIEGDDNWKVTRPQYTPVNPLLLNCMGALYPDPDIKMELIRSRHPKRPMDPVLFLLSNDPAVKPLELRATLPLTKLYKDPLPGMAVRTGWNFTKDSDDLVLTMNGGNRHLRNHQHGDLGSFQLYYREYLITDIGQYRIYNIPYDRLLNKNAPVHSMMRFYDPETPRPEKQKIWVNTGGQLIWNDQPPLTLKSFLNEKRFYCGETPRAGFGPSLQKPVYNFLETTLAPAYPGRLENYTRSFVFWNQNDKNRPGTLLILDRFKTSRKNIEPIFQLTTVQKAEVKNGVLTISAKNNKKSACVSVNTLIPARPEIKILTGDASRTFQGIHIPARFPDRREAHGSRIELRGKEDTFLNVLQVHDGELKPYPVSCSRKDGRTSVLLSIPGKACLTSFGNVDKVTDSAFSINIPEDNTQVLLLDLAPGKWSAVNKNSKKTFVVTKSNGSLYSVLSKGTWHLNLIKK